MHNKKHIIIYSHGFGVEKDDRDLFTDLASEFSSSLNIMFDYNLVDKANNTLIVTSLRQQSRKLTEEINKYFSKYPGSVIDLVCHSQGCVVAAASAPTAIRKTIFLAPPDNLDINKLNAKFNRPGSHIDINGESRLVRRDGTTTIVPKAYWDSIKNLQLFSLYNRFCKSTGITIIEATDDEVLGQTDFSKADETIGLQHKR